MASFILDTNHASRLMAKDPSLVARIRENANDGDDFGISMTILGELYYAVYASQQREQNLRRLQRLLASLVIYPFDETAAQEFGRIQAEQKAKGRPIPPLDAQIAAVARDKRLIVLTADRHFDFIANIVAENWLTE